jgi:hypothetical protein
MTKYAAKTTVSIDRSMGQVRQMLAKAGADGVAIAETAFGSTTQFIFDGKSYKFVITYPKTTDDAIIYTHAGRERTEKQIEAELESEKKRLWRSMGLYIKAALEAHNNGVIDLKRSMMSHMELPSGSTVYEKIKDSLDKIDVKPQLLLQ